MGFKKKQEIESGWFENLIVVKNSVLTNQNKEALLLIGRSKAAPFR